MSFVAGADWAGAVVLSAGWQGVLLASIAAVGLRMVPRTPAGVRFAVWFAVFGLMVGMPVVGMLRHAVNGAAGHSAWFTVDARWCVVLATAWVGASVMRAVSLLAAGLRVREIWRRAEPVDFGLAIGPDELQPDGECVLAAEQHLSAAKADLNIAPLMPGLKSRPILRHISGRLVRRRRAEVCVSDEVDRPAVIGFFAPKILIPRWLMEKLTAEELRQIVVHEAGHLSRADDWMNLLQKIALVIFPLNPALAWVERRLCFERELAVDEEVLRAFGGEPGAAHAYASCLARLAEFRLGRRAMALAIGAMGRESELGRRVKRILRRGDVMRPVHARMVMGCAMALLGAAAVGLERCPQLVGFGSSQQANSVVARGVTESMSQGLKPGLVRVEMSGLKPGPISKPGTMAKPGPGSKTLVKRIGGSALGVDVDGAIAVNVVARDRGYRAISRDERGSTMQWVMLTSWEGSSAASQGDAHPYAAVPVRGGWLVFQL